MDSPVPMQCHTLPSPFETSETTSMAPDDREAALGTCSFCGETVADQHVIIQYETAAGELGYWAECRNCGEIVDPHDAQ